MKIPENEKYPEDKTNSLDLSPPTKNWKHHQTQAHTKKKNTLEQINKRKNWNKNIDCTGLKQTFKECLGVKNKTTRRKQKSRTKHPKWRE